VLLHHFSNIFSNRNGDLFRPLLDYLRSGTLTVPPGVSLDVLKHEADFFGIDLAHAFLPTIRDGLYLNKFGHDLLFIERLPNMPFAFAVTGLVRVEEERCLSVFEFWKEVCSRRSICRHLIFIIGLVVDRYLRATMVPLHAVPLRCTRLAMATLSRGRSAVTAARFP